MGDLGTSETSESPVTKDFQPPGVGAVPYDSLITSDPSGQFEILALVGTGACSRVYKAKSIRDEKIVAIKVLHSHLLSHSETVARFEREAQSGMALNQNNICKIISYGHLGSNQPYIAMEFLEGESLSSILRRQGRMQLKDALPIFMACCDGLSAAHSKGVIHRDLKPANIFIVGPENGGAKLLDFGLAKILSENTSLTVSGTAVGTVQYMSPEQAQAEAVDSRSDIYSLACVMYETLSGRKIFTGQNAFEIMQQHAHKMPLHFGQLSPAPKIPSAMDAIVFKALAKKREERYQTADELKCALEVLHNSLLEQSKSEARVRTAIIIAVMAVVTALGVYVISNWR